MKPLSHLAPVALGLCLLAVSAPGLAAGSSVPDREIIPARQTSGVGRACATPDLTAEQMKATALALRRYVEEFGAAAVGGQIQVAFHVIYSGSEGNVPQSQIDAQIAELNKAYAGFYGGVNTGYTFVLASVDRTDNRHWFNMTPGGKERQAKRALATDVAHRLNIYTCSPGQNLLGWSYFPQSFPEDDWHHGVVIHYASLPGGSLAPYDLGGTADHEVGHYLGLYHTFQGGCTAPGDFVDDTPDEATPTSGCPDGKDTCPTAGLDPIHNYMDYSYDACYTEFTADQDDRMDGIVPVYRPSLLNAAVAQAFGKPDAGQFGGPEVVVDPAISHAALLGARPNPFRFATSVRFALPSRDRVSLRVYNVAGQLVRTLADGEFDSGEQSVTLRADDLPPGMYFTMLRVGSGAPISRSVILVR